MAHPASFKSSLESDFPYSLIISLPLPTHRLASAALRALQVDSELSPFVRRSFRLTRPRPPQPQQQQQQQELSSQPLPASSLVETTATATATATTPQPRRPGQGTDIPILNRTEGEVSEKKEGGQGEGDGEEEVEELTVLQTEYRATTNRMLRVAVNGFMESLGVVLGVMEELDVDILAGQLE
ncbi:uncharacterized protein PADG_04585 [Paracoccidioides brasiliensis Pb18]|uniref:Uncharacterized protein n=1 Tax=Paracoccidioides brasiliensis (strain Pb18) TaxID=502780 RepID=C1GC63_PARBD|nr:uncharacterized protein PADG_04585 [Paracoccidioides brasiliensis Pb18]EEH48506.2 hypothetical protein PADG_04585 [Paracoccidioides brasiliensis Pb18]